MAPYPKQGAFIGIGRKTDVNHTKWNQTRPIYRVISRLDGARTSDATVDRDVALLIVPPPSDAAAEELAYPSPLAEGLSDNWPNDDFIGYEAQFVGWGKTEKGAPLIRQYSYYAGSSSSALYLSHTLGPGPGALWNASWVDQLYYGIDHGDSGGPLYLYDESTGAPFQVGVASVAHAQDNDDGHASWVDITAPTIQDWLHSPDGGQDPDHPDKLIGQTDYVGACDHERDPDCDRFYDEPGHDNCPGTFNALQTPAHDADGDGVPDYCDNCIGEPNYDQADSDGDGFGDACDTCQLQTPSAFCSSDADCGGAGSCVDYVDWLDLSPGCYNPLTGQNACHAARCASDVDTDEDGTADLCDNCPGDYNKAQRNCNRHAEEALGLILNKVKGDACDPVPCADTDMATRPLISQFTPPVPPNLQGTDYYVADQTLDWRGVQEHNVTPTSLNAARGSTEFAHCRCSEQGDIDERVMKCMFEPGSATPKCEIGRRAAYPSDLTNMSLDGAAWRPVTTEYVPSSNFQLNCLYNGNTCPSGRHQIFDSAYERSPTLADDRQAYWRFDEDFGLYSLPAPSGAQDLLDRSHQLDGLGWAHTRAFAGQDLSTKPLAGTSLGSAGTYSDAASHYFIQDPNVGYHVVPPPPAACPAGVCGFSAWTEPVCLTCARSVVPAWLMVRGQTVEQMTGSVRLDVADSVDPGLLALLRDSSVQMVPVSESAALLGYKGNQVEAVAVDTATLARTALVYEGPEGLAALPLGYIDRDPPAGPRAFAASALERLVFIVEADAQAGERLFSLPVLRATEVPEPIVLQGINGTGTPLSLVYRADDGLLYLLDRVGGGFASWLRIVRIDPQSGSAQLLARWRYFGHHDQVYLSVNDPGELVLAGSARRESLLMTLAPADHGVRLTGWRAVKGHLLAPPDTRGDRAYTMVMGDRRDIPHVVEVPGSTLHQPGHGRHRGRFARHHAWRAHAHGMPPWCD